MRCPVCKADNAAGPACRRCKADLGLLFALEDERSALLAEARRLLDGGAWSAAADAAARADGLRRDDDSRRLLTAALLLGRDWEGAWRAFRGAPAVSDADRRPG
jgi:hypothetical protein